MNTLILRTAARLLIPIQVVFSLFLLLRGHNDPGGGFAAGLVIATAFALHALAFSPGATRQMIPIQPVTVAGLGLIVALGSGAIGLLAGDPFLTGHWLEGTLAGFKLGTPLMFDVGVYLLVIGVTAGILVSLMEGR